MTAKRLASRATFLVLTLLALTSCSASSPLQPYDILFSDVSNSDTTLGSDPAEITMARIEGDILHTEVTFGGGCADHLFSLIRPLPVWRESFIVQTDLRLTHESHGDPCRALLSRSLAFDLTPLRNAYRDSYPGGPSTIDISLYEPAGDSSPIRLRYEF